MCQLSKNHKLFHSTTVVNKQVGHRGSFDCFFDVGSHRDQSCHLWVQVFVPVTLHYGFTFIVSYKQLLFCDWFRDRRSIISKEWILLCFCDKSGLDVKIPGQNMAAVKLVREPRQTRACCFGWHHHHAPMPGLNMSCLLIVATNMSARPSV